MSGAEEWAMQDLPSEELPRLVAKVAERVRNGRLQPDTEQLRMFRRGPHWLVTKLMLTKPSAKRWVSFTVHYQAGEGEEIVGDYDLTFRYFISEDGELATEVGWHHGDQVIESFDPSRFSDSTTDYCQGALTILNPSKPPSDRYIVSVL